MPQEQTTTSSNDSKTYQPIEDYAVIGNMHTVALVGKNGSIDWCCIPRFDAPSVFGALLDAQKGGFFRIAPINPDEAKHKQLYFPDTNILVTRFLTTDGVGEIIDFMPVKQSGSGTHQHHILRSVRVVRGTLSLEMVCRPAFNYARGTISTLRTRKRKRSRCATYLFNRHKSISYDLWASLQRLLNWLSTHWQDTDEGIWEVRGGQRHFVHSRVMSWVAFDRGLRIARHRGLPTPFAQWENISAQIYEEIMQKGWNKRVGSFVQYYGSDAVDASALLISLTRFTGAAEPRMVSTIERIQKELTSDSHVFRYNPALAADDGFGGQEGTFSICSFWLVEALARAGRLEEARIVLEKMFTYANHVGLYAEEVGASGEALGNFPQAFTHLSLISACYNLDRALNGTLRG